MKFENDKCPTKLDSWLQSSPERADEANSKASYVVRKPKKGRGVCHSSEDFCLYSATKDVSSRVRVK